MGFQVTPCVMPSPEKEKDCAFTNCSKKGSEIKIVLPCASYDAQAAHGLLINSPCTSSLSVRSHSANFLLSQCSSLASLPSLGLSFNGSSDTQLGAAAVGTISAHFSCVITLRSHGDQVACIGCPTDSFFFSASSRSAATSSLNAWPKHGEAGLTHSATAFGSKKEGAVRALVVVGDRVFSAHDDLKVRVWARPGSVKKGDSCIGSGGGGGGGEHKLVATLPTTWDCLARSVVPGGYVQVRRHQKKLWIQHADAISALAVDSKEGYLYSASWDRTVKVWRLRDFKCIESFRAHDDAINALALSTDGFLYTASADGKIKVWARHNSTKQHRQHSLVATLEAHRSAVNALALSTDGTLLYSGACDKAIVVWEREDSAQHASLAGALRGHRQAVLCLTTWGATLCSGSADKSIRVWQRVAGRLHACVALLQDHGSPVKSLSISPSPDAADAAALFLYSAALDHDIKVWRLRLSFS